MRPVSCTATGTSLETGTIATRITMSSWPVQKSKINSLGTVRWLCVYVVNFYSYVSRYSELAGLSRELVALLPAYK